MLVWPSCRTTKEVEVKTVVYVPDIYFPDFPKLQAEICIPLNKDGKRVTDEETEITYYLIAPYYIDQLVQFKVSYKAAKAGYEAARLVYSGE